MPFTLGCELHLPLLLVLALLGARATEFEKVFEWKQMSYADLPDTRSAMNSAILFPRVLSAVENETFAPYDNIPMGATHYKGRLFIAIPRRRPGVPATVNVIDMARVTASGDRSPPLTAYPTYPINELRPGYEPDLSRLVSVYRTTVDICGRLWFVDTGMLEYPNNRRQVQRPQLWIVDLDQNRLVRRFTIPESIVLEGVGMASITVDVERDNCEGAFAYVPDLVANALYVYSMREDAMWAFTDEPSFVHDPARADFNVAGQRFRWDDGVFSVTVGQRDPIARSRLVYYHPMVSTTEFATYNSVLQNRTVAESGNYARLFEALGDRGPATQSTMHHYDPATGVLFYAEVNRNSIGCWNTRQVYGAENHAVVHLDNRELIYPSDLTSDTDGTLWVLTNNLPSWIYSRLNESEYNFRVWRQNPAVAIRGTKCDN